MIEKRSRTRPLRYGRKQQNQISSISSLPRELLAEIISKTCFTSIKDLATAKLVCKEFQEAAGDFLVFRHVPLEAIYGVHWKPYSQASLFLKQCEESDNPNVFYYRGMMEYFSKRQIELGRELLKKAAGLGHIEAEYVLGIILFSDESSEHQGTEILDKIARMKSENGSIIEKCRCGTEMMIKQLWINNTLQRRGYKCRNGYVSVSRRKEDWLWGWSFEEQSFCCDDCKWVYELNRFCDRLT